MDGLSDEVSSFNIILSMGLSYKVTMCLHKAQQSSETPLLLNEYVDIVCNKLDEYSQNSSFDTSELPKASFEEAGTSMAEIYRRKQLRRWNTIHQRIPIGQKSSFAETIDGKTSTLTFWPTGAKSVKIFSIFYFVSLFLFCFLQLCFLYCLFLFFFRFTLFPFLFFFCFYFTSCLNVGI